MPNNEDKSLPPAPSAVPHYKKVYASATCDSQEYHWRAALLKCALNYFEQHCLTRPQLAALRDYISYCEDTLRRRDSERRANVHRTSSASVGGAAPAEAEQASEAICLPFHSATIASLIYNPEYHTQTATDSSTSGGEAASPLQLAGAVSQKKSTLPLLADFIAGHPLHYATLTNQQHLASSGVHGKSDLGGSGATPLQTIGPDAPANTPSSNASMRNFVTQQLSKPLSSSFPMVLTKDLVTVLDRRQYFVLELDADDEDFSIEEYGRFLAKNRRNVTAFVRIERVGISRSQSPLHLEPQASWSTRRNKVSSDNDGDDDAEGSDAGNDTIKVDIPSLVRDEERHLIALSDPLGFGYTKRILAAEVKKRKNLAAKQTVTKKKTKGKKKEEGNTEAGSLNNNAASSPDEEEDFKEVDSDHLGDSSNSTLALDDDISLRSESYGPDSPYLRSMSFGSQQASRSGSLARASSVGRRSAPVVPPPTSESMLISERQTQLLDYYKTCERLWLRSKQSSNNPKITSGNLMRLPSSQIKRVTSTYSTASDSPLSPIKRTASPIGRMKSKTKKQKSQERLLFNDSVLVRSWHHPNSPFHALAPYIEHHCDEYQKLSLDAYGDLIALLMCGEACEQNLVGGLADISDNNNGGGVKGRSNTTLMDVTKGAYETFAVIRSKESAKSVVNRNAKSFLSSIQLLSMLPPHQGHFTSRELFLTSSERIPEGELQNNTHDHTTAAINNGASDNNHEIDDEQLQAADTRRMKWLAGSAAADFLARHLAIRRDRYEWKARRMLRQATVDAENDVEGECPTNTVSQSVKDEFVPPPFVTVDRSQPFELMFVPTTSTPISLTRRPVSVLCAPPHRVVPRLLQERKVC